MRAAAKCFKTALREEVTLEAGSCLRLDFAVKVGDITSTVEVAARTAMVETETGSPG